MKLLEIYNMRMGFFLIVFFWISACRTQLPVEKTVPLPANEVQVGAEQVSQYLPQINASRVAVVANHTAIVNHKHLVDTLISLNINVVKVFAPEHGFRGDLPPGEKFDSYTDKKTGIHVVSLYGKHAKPKAEDLEDVEVVIFDIQDVGARFYTYLTTLYYVMQSCAEQNKQLIVLDRPNPNGHYVDGPILSMDLKSMVGALPIPIVHGCTLGEMSKMIKGENWGNTKSLDLKVVSCNNWTHQTRYSLPIPPSPNLSSDCAIALYPSLCWFEGTSVSVGRGTESPFTCYGFPSKKNFDFIATPVDVPGKVTDPPHENFSCGFVDLREDCSSLTQINLSYLMDAYAELGDAMFSSPVFFDKLAGTMELRIQLKLSLSANDIRESWERGLQDYLSLRKKYLMYP
jgi:uncharacterized protein YbbC (DUF1343 family)